MKTSSLPIFDRIMGVPVVKPGEGYSLLAGVTVLDLSTSVAGPYATMLLSDFGARVVKIERRGEGDDARSWGPPFLDNDSLWFIAMNRNKESLTLDITASRGKSVLLDLVAKADVMLVNQSRRVVKKLGIDPEAMTAANPRLIYVSVTGFGFDGERADWPCYDLIAEGYSGVMDLTGELNGRPQKVGAPAADMLAGQDAAMATMAALFARHTTGRGSVVDVALVDSMTRFLSCRIASYLGSGDPARRSGGTDSVIAVYQSFETADEPLTLGLGNSRIWKRFWKTVGRPEYGDRAEFSTNAERRAARSVIVAEIQAILRQKPRSQWLAQFATARVPAGPINRIDELPQDEELVRRGLLYYLEDGERTTPQVGTGIQINGVANVPRSGPPRMGAHTRAILQTMLGYDTAMIDALSLDGTI